jgi:hypothetical protein
MRHGIISAILRIRRESAAHRLHRSAQDLLFDMAKTWTNIALVESDVAKQAAADLFVSMRALHF